MANLRDGRCSHYLLLLLAGCCLFFPNLGGHSLWDIDESHNAECAREMMEAENWRVPTFNFTLRTDKPVMQYWLVILAYHIFGVTEFAARFWSAVSALGSLFATYELGRRMFGPSTGLLAGLLLGSSVMFCVSAHAVTPDALLILFTVLTLGIFWLRYSAGRQDWLIWCGLTSGLAVLTKGPVGLLLPATAIGLFLLWERRLKLLWNRRLIWGVLLFALVAVPWYVIVGVETRRQFWEGFFLQHNFGRFISPMERHDGSPFYHLVALCAAFAPWSAFLGPVIWFATGTRAKEDKRAVSGEWSSGESEPIHHSPLTNNHSPCYRFLWCWVAVWLIFFSIARTKLPNYILPIYPALALLTARFLVRWRAKTISFSPVLMTICFACFGLVGIVAGTGLLIASGAFPWQFLPEGSQLPAVAPWALAGLLPVAGAMVAWLCARLQLQNRSLAAVAISGVSFVALLAAYGPLLVDRHNLPWALADDMARNQHGREVRIGCFRYYQPGLVFYARRQVERLKDDLDAQDLVNSPLQTFLITPAETWDKIAPAVYTNYQVVSRRYDFMTGKEIVLVTNKS